MKADHIDVSRPDLAVARLRRAILTGQLQPGERLVEQHLAEELQVSRGPIRDALRQLEQEGLVRIYRNRGAVVSTLGPLEAYELYLVRGHMEGLAVRLARDHMGAEDIAYLDDLVGQMRELHDLEEDWLPTIDLDLAFHRHIVACSKNCSLIQLYNSMDSRIGALFMAVKQHLSRRPTLMPGLHQRIVDVFRSGDWWRAEQVVTEHWHETAADFKQVHLRMQKETGGDGLSD